MKYLKTYNNINEDKEIKPIILPQQKKIQDNINRIKRMENKNWFFVINIIKTIMSKVGKDIEVKDVYVGTNDGEAEVMVVDHKDDTILVTMNSGKERVLDLPDLKSKYVYEILLGLLRSEEVIKSYGYTALKNINKSVNEHLDLPGLDKLKGQISDYERNHKKITQMLKDKIYQILYYVNDVITFDIDVDDMPYCISWINDLVQDCTITSISPNGSISITYEGGSTDEINIDDLDRVGDLEGLLDCLIESSDLKKKLNMRALKKINKPTNESNEELTVSQIKLLEYVEFEITADRFSLSREEIEDANKLVKMGYLVKGTSENRQANRFFSLTGKNGIKT